MFSQTMRFPRTRESTPMGDGRLRKRVFLPGTLLVLSLLGLCWLMLRDSTPAIADDPPPPPRQATMLVELEACPFPVPPELVGIDLTRQTEADAARKSQGCI